MASRFLPDALMPWSRKQRAAEQRLTELRQRDGDNCRRCRRELRFDLPRGHDRAPVVTGLGDGATACLTHRRCNVGGADFTSEVQERVRRKHEEALFAKPQRKRAAASR